MPSNFDPQNVKTCLWLYPYGPSEGAKTLARHLTYEGFGVKQIKKENSTFKGNAQRTVINWGNSGDLPDEIKKCRVVNSPDRVGIASNKKKFFEHIRDFDGDKPRIPPFTLDKEEARQWLIEGHTLFARTKLTGHSGEGIVDVQTLGQLDEVKDGTLLVRYILKKEEWRIHVANGEVFLRQRKAYKRPDEGDVNLPHPNWRIRNHKNGYIFERNGGNRPDADIERQAVLAVQATGLDFGAVDVLWNRKAGEAYVIEINTAPGITNSTVEDYAAMIRRNFG